MADRAHTGFGAELQRGDGQSPENFHSIVGIKSITGPNIQRDTHDTTDMQSTNFREFIGGLVDAGEVQFEGNFIPTDDTQGQGEGGFLAEFDKTSCDSRRNWRILVPECEGEPDVYLEFAGVVTAAGMGFPMDDLMPFNGTIKVSGRPELVITT